MAATHEASVSAQGEGVSSVTVGSQAAAGSNRLAVGVFTGGDNGGAPSITSVTRGGSEVFTEVFDTRGTGGFYEVVQASYYIAPAAAAASTVFVMSKTAGGAAQVSYLSGMAQSSPLRGSSTNRWSSTTAPSRTLTTVSGDMCIDILGYYSNPTVGSGQTHLMNRYLSSGGWYADSSYEVATGTSTVMSWSGSPSNGALMGALAFIPAAGDLEADGVTALVTVTSPTGTAAKSSPKAATGVTATVVVTAGEGTATSTPLSATGVTSIVVVTAGEGAAAKEAQGVTATVVVTAGEGTATSTPLAATGVTATVVVTAGEGTATSTPLAATGVTATVVVTAGEGTAALEGGDLDATGVTATVVVTAGEGTAAKEAALSASGVTASVVVTAGTGTAAKEAALAADGVSSLVVVTAGVGAASSLQLDGPITFVVRLSLQGFESRETLPTTSVRALIPRVSAAHRTPTTTVALRRGTMEAQEA